MVDVAVLLVVVLGTALVGYAVGRRRGWSRGLVIPWALSVIVGLAAGGYAAFVDDTCTEVCGPTVLGLTALVLLGAAVALTAGCAIGVRRRPLN